MFNDLNNPNRQNQQPVDDIFAETDRNPEGANTPASPAPAAPGSPITPGAPVGVGSANIGIDTRRVGLTASDGMVEEAAEKTFGNKWFKISLIAVIAAIVILGAYLVYSKFFKASPDLSTELTANPSAAGTVTNPTQTAANPEVTPSQPSTSVTPTGSGSFVTPTSGETAVNTPEAIPSIPGVNTSATTSPANVAPSDGTVNPGPVALIDSDSDGLTDAEEQAVGTNINVIDTDNDGLSDYEEVKIYHSNPLSADSDDDGYLDGAEVKNGYNPNGTGKLMKAADTLKMAQ
ncbi:MAG: hypothetical protein WC453_01485 [Patescibacteria group bacterium]